MSYIPSRRVSSFPSEPSFLPPLSIASRFMKVDSYKHPSEDLNPAIHARRESITGSSLTSCSMVTTNEPVHPLDCIPTAVAAGSDFRLDLRFAPPRPFGSQDTLVNQRQENKYDQISLSDTSSNATTCRGDDHPDLEKQQECKQTKDEDNHRRYCGRRWRVFALFLTTLGLILLSFLFWPRTPLIRIEGASLVSPPKITETNQGLVGNVQFETSWRVNFTVDNRQNGLLPTRLVQLHVLVKDALNGNVVGKGDHPETIILDPGMISTVPLSIVVDYQARDVSDTTFASLKDGCTDTRDALALSFWMTLHIWGLDFFGYRPTVIVAPATGGFVCPLS